MRAEKIVLQRPKPCGWVAPGRTIIPIHSALPYYTSRRGKYVHIIRSGQWHTGAGRPHASYSFWCGGNGYSSRGVLSASPNGSVLCATCEGRAVGIGAYGEKTINGRPVLFEPRKEGCE